MTVSDEDLVRTRASVHAICEHVLAAVRYEAVGRIGLTVVPGGFATPPYGDDGRSIGLIDGVLTIRDESGDRSRNVSTLREAGEFAGIEPGAPADVYLPTTPCGLDADLFLSPTHLRSLVEWYGLVASALDAFRAQIAADDPSSATLWPEHFDLAIRAADANYGGLAGDGAVAEPYLYVGPMPEVLDSGDPFWNQPFGATRTWHQVTSSDDAVRFFAEGREIAVRRAAGRR